MSRLYEYTVHEGNGTRTSWGTTGNDGYLKQMNIEVSDDGHYFYDILHQRSGYAGENRDKKGH